MLERDLKVTFPFLEPPKNYVLLRVVLFCFFTFPVNFWMRRWRQTSETDQVVISHNVTNYEFFYEPFYIGRDDAPPHDERFLG